MAPAIGMVVTFRNHVTPDEAASKTQGRPIFRDMEVCDIRLAGQKALYTFPAHEADPNATREAGETVTYAQRYNEQYRAFKADAFQPDGGTPLSEAPFLTEAKRRELKAMNVRTVETLAAIDGTPLKQLGMGGREMKMQAQAYLEKAAGSSDVTAMAATIAALQQQLEDQREFMNAHVVKDQVPVDDNDPPVADETDDSARNIDKLTDHELKDYIKDKTGEPVRGNPSRETLLKRAGFTVE